MELEVFDKNKESLGTYTTDSDGIIRLEKMFLGDSIYYIEEKENTKSICLEIGFPGVAEEIADTGLESLWHIVIAGVASYQIIECQLSPNEVLELLLAAGESELWKVDLSGQWGPRVTDTARSNWSLGRDSHTSGVERRSGVRANGRDSWARLPGLESSCAQAVMLGVKFVVPQLP